MLWLYFISLILVLLFHRFIGSCVFKLGAPRIIGDIIAGCLLGPTIMGLSANWSLFPASNRELIGMSGQLGLIFTSMSAGFGFDHRVLAGRQMIVKTLGYTFLNMALPTLVAVPLTYILPDTDRWRGPSSEFQFGSYFTLIACAMASSALPMIFLILDELKIKHRFAIGFSCLSTIGLFTMLSVASALAKPNDVPQYMIGVRLVLLLVAAVVLGLMQHAWSHLSILKPILRLVDDNTTLFVISVTLGSAVISERLGYTFLLGGFLAGAAMPFDVSLRSGLGDKVRWMTRWLFLPQYFLYSGLSFNLREITASDVPYIILFVVMAFGAKALLIPVTHYVFGMTWKEAAFCASLANCRGFNALIIGDTGRQLGQIGDALYVTCTLLSVLSTSAAGPLARIFKPEQIPEDEVAAAHTHTRANHPRTPRQLTPRMLTPRTQGQEQAHNTQEQVELKADAAIASDEYDEEEDNDAPEARREQFESWLSERADQNERDRVLVCFPQDISGRMRDARHGIPCQKQRVGEELKFTGTAAVDWLLHFYRIDRRSMAVELAQRLLEAGIFSPVATPVFLDDTQHWYSFGM